MDRGSAITDPPESRLSDENSEEENKAGDGDEVDDEQAGANPMTSQSVLDTATAQARFSINVLNILDPPKELSLGRWNPRDLEPKHWKRLKLSMLDNEIKPWNYENMIPIIISPRHVDPSCISTNITDPSKSPVFKLSPDGERELSKILLAGGRHRIQAVKSIHDDKQAEQKKLKEKLEKLRKAEPKRETLKKRYDQDMTDLEDRILDGEKYLSTIGPWGVILYDEGKCISLSEM